MKEVAIHWYFSYNGEPQAWRQAKERKKHLNLSPQARSGNHSLLRQADDLDSVKPFYILWKYSDFCGKGNVPLQMCFLPELVVSPLLLLSVLTLQDKAAPIPAYQPVKVTQAVWDTVSFTCLRLSCQNYTLATEVHSLLLQTPSIKSHSLLLSLPSGPCVCTAGAGRCLLALSFLVRSRPAGSATWLSPICPGSALCTALAFSGLMINA